MIWFCKNSKRFVFVENQLVDHRVNPPQPPLQPTPYFFQEPMLNITQQNQCYIPISSDTQSPLHTYSQHTTSIIRVHVKWGRGNLISTTNNNKLTIDYPSHQAMMNYYIMHSIHVIIHMSKLPS